jgi:hypothetical protein
MLKSRNGCKNFLEREDFKEFVENMSLFLIMVVHN